MSLSPEPSADEIRQRLAAIHDELLALGPGDFEPRYRLEVERDRLRDLARVAADPDVGRSTEDLAAELASRRSALTALEKSLVNPAAMSGAGGDGSGAFEGPLDGMKIQHLQEESSGLTGLRLRVARLETLLADRRSAE